MSTIVYIRYSDNVLIKPRENYLDAADVPDINTFELYQVSTLKNIRNNMRGDYINCDTKAQEIYGKAKYS